MKISGFGSITSTGSSKRRNTGGVSGFADLLASAESQGVSHASAAGEVAALTNLLALQEISEEEVQRRKLVQRGHNLLEALEELRSMLLIGAIPLHVLRDLERQLSIQKQNINDPKLMAIIEDIELRAAVELAKLQMAAENPAQS